MASSPGFQSGNAGFESRWDHCGFRTKVSTSDCGSEDMGSIPIGHTYIYYIEETHAVCPGGEGAVLKTVGLKRLAGSNPVYGVYRWMSRIGIAADCKFVASALGVQVPLHLLYACIIWRSIKK